VAGSPRGGGLRRDLAFSLGSAGRRPALFFLVWAGMVALVVAAVAALPGTYEVESTLVYTPSPILTVRQDQTQVLPTPETAELVRRRENLARMVRESGLLAEWAARRGPLLRAKDALFEWLRGKPSEQERAEALADVLEKKLEIWAGKDGSVLFRVRWSDSGLTYRLARAAQDAFLAERWEAEVGRIEKLVGILSAHEKVLAARVQEELRRLEREADGRAASVASAAPFASGALPELRELRELRARREGVRRKLDQAELDRRRRSSGFREELNQKRDLYTESHPIMVGLRQRIEMAEREGPEETRLRAEERDLSSTIEDLEIGVSSPGGVSRGRERPYLARAAASRAATERLERPRAQGTLRDQADAVRARIEKLQIELEVARAAFPRRYVVVRPPEPPRGPIAPRAPLVIVSAAVYGALLALFATTLAERRHGALREAWQLEAALGRSIPVVEVRLS
jgi:uncharacterized protein involved in exopolysaccharide biosynthesis